MHYWTLCKIQFDDVKYFLIVEEAKIEEWVSDINAQSFLHVNLIFTVPSSATAVTILCKLSPWTLSLGQLNAIQCEKGLQN